MGGKWEMNKKLEAEASVLGTILQERTTPLSLHAEHQADLQKSGLSEETIKLLGIHSAKGKGGSRNFR